VWSTFVVILGMAAVWIGQRTGVTWLQDADPIGRARCRRDRDLDRVAAGKAHAGRVARRGSRRPAAARCHSRREHGWRDIDRARPRAPAPGTNISWMSPSACRAREFRAGGTAISDAVEHRVAEIVPADVMVHMEPRPPWENTCSTEFV